jgi:serine/threonine-protein kinase
MSVWSSAALGLVAGRLVVVAGSYDNNVYCLDGLTGERRWRFTTGGGVYAAPVIWRGAGRPLVFAGSSDRLVYALDADLGRREWVHALKTWRPTMGGARLSSPCVGRARGKDAVFIGHWVWDKSMSGHLQAGGATALDARTGKLLWTVQLGDNQMSSPIFVELDGRGRLFVASENGNLYALDAESGATLWIRTDRDAIKGSPAYFDSAGGPRVVIGSKFGSVRSLDARTGKAAWSFKTGHWVDGSAAVAQVGGRTVVFIGSYDTNLYALDGQTGVMIWSYRTGAGVYSSPAVAEDRQGRVMVLVSSWDHHLHCVSGENGTLLWKVFTGRPLWDSVSLGDSVWASPSAAEVDGEVMVYVGSYAGPLHAVSFSEAARNALARPGSNRAFWVTLPVVLLAVGLLTILLSRWQRRQGQR